MKFILQRVDVVVGDTVEWTNEDAMLHSVVADKGLFTGPNLKQQESYSFTFDGAPGTVDYHCGIHPKTMKGTVVVAPALTKPRK